MGRNKKNLNHAEVNAYEITKDVKNMVTQVPEPSDQIPKILVNSDKRITLTRIIKLYDPISLYKNAREISTENTDEALFMSKFQLYKHCINAVPVINASFKKVDDSTFVSFSRISLPTEIDCYLFSLISPDIFNFDENGDFVCNYIKENFRTYSELEAELRYSIILDGFLLAIDEILVTDNADYRFSIDDHNSIDILNKQDKIITDESNDYKVRLLKLIHPAIYHFFTLYKNVNSSFNEKNDYIDVNTLLTSNFLVSRNYMNDRIKLLIKSYNEHIAEPTHSELSCNAKILQRLLSLYHINRYTHLIDMYLMRDFNESTLHLHKINGLLTSIVINKIFNKDITRNKKEFEYELKYHTSIPDTDIYGKHSSAALGERDIIFIRTIIQKVAHIFKDIYFAKVNDSNEKATVVIDYKKAYNMFCDFEKDTSVATFLKESSLTEIIFQKIDSSVASLKDCYKLIYNDLVRNAGEDA